MESCPQPTQIFADSNRTTASRPHKHRPFGNFHRMRLQRAARIDNVRAGPQIELPAVPRAGDDPAPDRPARKAARPRADKNRGRPAPRPPPRKARSRPRPRGRPCNVLPATRPAGQPRVFPWSIDGLSAAFWGRHDSRVSVSADSPSHPSRRAVVVLGMHRSGTSAVAGCLHRLGVDFGPRLMPATEDNARGYFEHVDIVNLHDRLLLALGGGWDETRPFLPREWPAVDPLTDPYRTELFRLLQRDLSAAPLWGLKDPRLCRLLPWWEPVWAATDTWPLFVIVRRPPSEVAASLARREGFSPAKSYLLWLLHTLGRRTLDPCLSTRDRRFRRLSRRLAVRPRTRPRRAGPTLALSGRCAVRRSCPDPFGHR